MGRGEQVKEWRNRFGVFPINQNHLQIGQRRPFGRSIRFSVAYFLQAPIDYASRAGKAKLIVLLCNITASAQKCVYLYKIIMFECSRQHQIVLTSEKWTDPT